MLFQLGIYVPRQKTLFWWQNDMPMMQPFFSYLVQRTICDFTKPNNSLSYDLPYPDATQCCSTASNPLRLGASKSYFSPCPNLFQNIVFFNFLTAEKRTLTFHWSADHPRTRSWTCWTHWGCPCPGWVLPPWRCPQTVRICWSVSFCASSWKDASRPPLTSKMSSSDI